MNKHKPLPKQLSMWNSCTEIIYACPICGCDFRFYGSKEKYCHECGNMIDWTNVPLHCSEDFKKKYEKLVYNYGASLRNNPLSKYDTELIDLLFKLYKGEIV